MNEGDREATFFIISDLFGMGNYSILSIKITKYKICCKISWLFQK